jgi:hypothetical protein
MAKKKKAAAAAKAEKPKAKKQIKDLDAKGGQDVKGGRLRRR